MCIRFLRNFLSLSVVDIEFLRYTRLIFTRWELAMEKTTNEKCLTRGKKSREKTPFMPLKYTRKIYINFRKDLLLLLLFTTLEFFTSVLADGFSLEFE